MVLLGRDIKGITGTSVNFVVLPEPGQGVLEPPAEGASAKASALLFTFIAAHLRYCGNWLPFTQLS